MHLSPTTWQTLALTLTLLLPSTTAQTDCNPPTLDLAPILEKIEPKTATCNPQDTQCRNATVVAPLLSSSFQKYNVTCRQEAACLVGLAMLESVNFQSMRNKDPGRAGQGTVNMQMCNFNLKWARELNNASFPDVTGEINCLEKECKDKATCDQVLNTVLETERGQFSSLAWFYKKQCNKPLIKEALRNNVSACSDYLQECIGVKPNDGGRVSLNKKAFEAFGVANATECVPL
ncbi:hypothetical protein CDD80_7477 [Ophiocordyceps camponoti-rufipedis]|uniref:Uncharacterized protein n=1 Tax=Ophiocordyceps camponoti-rufipedis TaxID=2004952 RepID=A0A2C5Z834_9HYPO|nr:hypothetical protein CDD80_7477 [Ophiocordyceps camponoti-rufipedis]